MNMINAAMGLHRYQITAELLDDDNQVVEHGHFTWMSRLTKTDSLNRFRRNVFSRAVNEFNPPIGFAVRVVEVQEVPNDG